MILNKLNLSFKENNSDTYVSQNQLLKLIDRQDFKKDLTKVFQFKEDEIEVIQVGNAKSLLNSLFELDSQCEKIDIDSKIKNIELMKMLDKEKAIFEIIQVSDEEILKKNKSDRLIVETVYSAKHDLLDYYNFSRFANYLRDFEYDDLINTIKSYLKIKNMENGEARSLRLLYKKDENKFYLRAVTSTDGYQDFGINFSVVIALIVLSRYALASGNEVYINNYVVDDSTVYVSFSLSNEKTINKNLKLSFNLILENDEIKRNAVSFNGVFKLRYEDNAGRNSEIFLKPKGLKKDEVSYPVDLLTYRHRGNVKSVFNKLKELPELIDFFVKQVAEDTERISQIKNPKDVRTHLANKVKRARKSEFQKYKSQIFNKLMKITVDNTFNLFEVFREVEELFENEDVVSRDYWRTKLYESLVEKI